MSPSCYAKPLECLLTGRAGDVDNKEQRMGQTIRVMAVGVLMLMLSAGAAFGAIPVLTGTNGDDQLKGTNKAEEIRGLGGEDEIVDGLGKDVVYGGAGSDNLIGYGGDTSVDGFRGAAGDDIIQSVDVPATKDRVSCGSGVDRVDADKADAVSDNCERVKTR
jgi:Ca2+-binding RTX toxin-like protein